MKITLTILILLTTYAAGFCGDLELAITGDCDISNGDIRRAFFSAESDSARVKSVRDLFLSESYPEADVQLIEPDRLAVIPGMRYRIGSISIIGDTQENTRDLVADYSGKAASGVVVERFTRELLRFYSESGNPFAQVSIEETTLDGIGRVDFVARIASGPRTLFDSCKVEGTDARTADYLSRVSAVSPGEPFNDTALDETRRILRAHGFIRVHDSVDLDFRDDYTRCVPIFRVDRLPTNSLDGSLGYQPSVGDRSAYVKGYALLQFENLFGRGRRFSIRYNKRDPLSHEVAFGYYQPYLYYMPVSVEFAIEQSKYDSLYQQLSIESRLFYREDARVSLRMSGGWSSYTPLGTEFRGVFHSRRYWWGIGTDLTIPGSIIRQIVDLDIVYGIKQQYRFAGVEPPDTRITDTRLTGGYRMLVSFGKLLHFSAKASAAAIVTEERMIPQSDLYRLGGADRLRGYREDQFFCDRYVLVILQPELHMSDEASFHLFSDAAWFRQQDSGSELREGAGAGFEFRLPTGRLLLDVAWGRDDRFSDGKLYARLESRF
jgi:outer membrane protein assembly factor BamA